MPSHYPDVLISGRRCCRSIWLTNAWHGDVAADTEIISPIAARGVTGGAASPNGARRYERDRGSTSVDLFQIPGSSPPRPPRAAGRHHPEGWLASGPPCPVGSCPPCPLPRTVPYSSHTRKAPPCHRRGPSRTPRPAGTGCGAGESVGPWPGAVKGLCIFEG